MLILLPYIELLDSGNTKGDIYTGIYNFDITNIVSVEPDKDGDTLIRTKFGEPYIFKVPCEDFIEFLSTRITIDVGLLDNVRKYDEGMGKRIDVLLNQQSNKND